MEAVNNLENNKRHTSIKFIDQETSIIEDTYLLAAILTFEPKIKYSPLRDKEGKVSFKVYGRIADEMGRLYAGEKAPLKAYISNLKTLRSAIFALRNTSKKPNPVSSR